MAASAPETHVTAPIPAHVTTHIPAPFLPELPTPSLPPLAHTAAASLPPDLPVLPQTAATSRTAIALLEPPEGLVSPDWAGPEFTKRTQQLLPSAKVPLSLAPGSESLGFAQVLLMPIVPNGLALAVDHVNTPPDLTALAEAVEPKSPEARPELDAPPAVEEVPTPIPEVAAAPEAAELQPEVKAQPAEVSPPIANSVGLPWPRIAAQDHTLASVDPNREPAPLRAAVLDLAAPRIDLPVLSPRLAGDPLRMPPPKTVAASGPSPGSVIQMSDALPVQVAAPIRPSLQPVAAPAIAGLVEYYSVALRAMRPARPSKVWFVPPAEPRITLPGPALSRELNSLAGAGLRPVFDVPRASRRRSGLGVVWTGLAAVALLAAAGVYVVPMLLVSGKAPSVQADAPPDPAPGTPVAGTYPLSKTIEVTGIRFVVDLNGKSEIHYLVVNHSTAQFGAVTVYVTLRGADARPGQAPVARFSFRAPDMGPYTSREMTSPIEKISRQVNLPDWQDLHADVEIAQ